MEYHFANTAYESLVEQLNDEKFLNEYKQQCDGYNPSFLPRMLGNLLVWCGNKTYGRSPSYLKFRAVEVIARVPYHSWSSAAFTLLTIFYSDEKRALELCEVDKYARFASDNETMHVVVISQLAYAEEKARAVRHIFIPMLFAFLYFWASYVMYIVKPRWSLELNYLFEQHAFNQYDEFLTLHSDTLQKKEMSSDFLRWYGRHPKNQFEFFRSVRNDELIHRNRSIEEIIEKNSK